MPGDYLPLGTGDGRKTKKTTSHKKLFIGLAAALVLLVIVLSGRSQTQSAASNEETVGEEAELHQSSQGKRVAIIGAGASGCSAAFFLSRAAQEAKAKGFKSIQEIVVYESNSYVGGRKYKLCIADARLDHRIPSQ